MLHWYHRQYIAQSISRSCIGGGAARSKGNIEAMRRFVQSHGQQTGVLLIELTDLNIARALTRVACGCDDVRLAEPLNTIFRVSQIIRKSEVLIS